MNKNRTCIDSDANLTQPRSPSDLRSWLHGYRIRNRGLTGLPRSSRASIIIDHLDAGSDTPAMRRAASELAEIDPALSWLPAWRPRVSVRLSKGDGA